MIREAYPRNQTRLGIVAVDRSEEGLRALHDQEDDQDDADDHADDELAHRSTIGRAATRRRPTGQPNGLRFANNRSGAQTSPVGHHDRVAAEEVWISVDVEASGPSPSTGSLLAIGACLVDDPYSSLYLELKPVPGMPWSLAAARVHRLSRERLIRNGLEPADAMGRFDDWVEEVSEGREPVMVGWNADFDWMFIADYFARFMGANPFGHAPLDIKAFAMGRLRLERWAHTRREALVDRFAEASPLSHHALEDAQSQAVLFKRLLMEDDRSL